MEWMDGWLFGCPRTEGKIRWYHLYIETGAWRAATRWSWRAQDQVLPLPRSRHGMRPRACGPLSASWSHVSLSGSAYVMTQPHIAVHCSGYFQVDFCPEIMHAVPKLVFGFACIFSDQMQQYKYDFVYCLNWLYIMTQAAILVKHNPDIWVSHGREPRRVGVGGRGTTLSKLQRG